MKKLFLGILVILSIVPLVGLLHPGLPWTHDGKDHVARIANFFINLQQGNVIPRWAGNLNWGYGHPILEFLYPLPSYLASFFHLLGFSFIDATKIVYGIGFFASGICMYLWLAEFLPIPAAFIGGMLYMFTPYRFVELYVRGDIGENLAFVFMPLTLLFIYKLYKKAEGSKSISLKQIPKEAIFAAVSFACLMLSHNAIVLMYFPFIIFYCIYLAYISKNTFYILRTTCYSLLLGFALSAFFWVPALFEGKYTLRNIVTAGGYIRSFVSLPQLLYGPWNYGQSGQFTVQLGILNWIIIILALPFYIFSKKVGAKHFLPLQIALLVYTLIGIFIMLPQSNFIWSKIMLLQNFQFAWRFLAIPLFTTSVLGAILIALLFKTNDTKKPFPLTLILSLRERKLFLVAFLVIILLFLNKDYWHAKGYLYFPDSFFSGIYNGTTDTGESAPMWSVRFMEKRPKQPVEVISGKGNVTPQQHLMTKHVYTVHATTDIQLRENTVYFPGWQVLVDGTLVPIQYQDIHNRGVITFYVPHGVHTVVVSYKETKLRLIADYISLLTILFISVLYSVLSMQRTARIN